MTFEQYWNAVVTKKGGKLKDTLTMSKEQFKKMQKQAFELGEKSASEKSDTPNFDSIFGDAFKRK